MNRDGWAMVCNPNPANSLPLSLRPDAASLSLGEFYTRTPVQVDASGNTGFLPQRRFWAGNG